MTAEQERELRPLIHWALQAWRTDVDYDDLVQEASVAAWIAWGQKAGQFQFTTIVVQAARWAAIAYKRSPRCFRRDQLRTTGDGRRALPEVISYDALAESDESDWLTAPDPIPALVDRLAAESLWATAARCCRNDRERQLLRGLMVDELPAVAVAARLGISGPTLHEAKNRLYARIRAAAGPPPARPAARAGKPAPAGY